MKRAISILTMALLLCSTAMAADYPVNVEYTAEDGIHEIRKYYEMTVEEEPTEESRQGFVLEGYSYSLIDLLRQELPHEQSRGYEETVTVDSPSKELGDVLPLLAESKEIITEDGFVGLLTLDTPSIEVEVAGYKNSSWTVTASRTYPNLSNMDLQYIPTTTVEQGRTLTLADVDWQTDNTYNADDYGIGDRFTAHATYTGTASSKNATGYTVSAQYRGTVEKISLEDVRYVAIFRGTALPVPEEPTQPLDWRIFAIPMGILALCGIGFGVSKIKHRKGENSNEKVYEAEFETVDDHVQPNPSPVRSDDYPGVGI